jgi:hypothetical protein
MSVGVPTKASDGLFKMISIVVFNGAKSFVYGLVIAGITPHSSGFTNGHV